MQKVKKFEFSKLILAISLVLNIAIIAIVCYIVIKSGDTSPLCYLAIGDGGALATTIAFYFWKSKNENRYKHCHRILNECAEKYGTDTAIQIAEIILKD